MIGITYHSENAFPEQLERSHKYKDRIGFWADVTDLNSTDNSVTVINDQGWEIEGIQVSSKTWVVKENGKDFSSAERCLPPIGSRVFVLVPDGNIASAFILCSGFPMGETNVQDLWCHADGSTKEGQKQIQKLNRIGEKISQGGWHTKENYDTGNSKLESADGEISLEVNPIQVTNSETGQVEEKKIVKIKAWDNELEISPLKDEEKGIKKQIVLTLLGNTITITDEGLIIEDVNENKITTNDKGIILDDANGCEVKTSSKGIECYKDKNSTSSNYIKLGTKISLKGSSGTMEIT